MISGYFILSCSVMAVLLLILLQLYVVYQCVCVRWWWLRAIIISCIVVEVVVETVLVCMNNYKQLLMKFLFYQPLQLHKTVAFMKI